MAKASGARNGNGRRGKASQSADTTRTNRPAEPNPQRSRGYPRPMLERRDWICLNGRWDFTIDHARAFEMPDQVQWSTQIVVPFSPETPASGVGDTGLYARVWYRRVLQIPEFGANEQVLLHFGAVDYDARVFANGSQVAHHEGGYTPFYADVTAAARSGTIEIVVRADDDPADLAKPRGKQDWQLEPHSIWYPRTTGIWQTVWLETVPRTRVGRVRWIPNLERWEIGLDARIDGADGQDLHLGLTLRVGDTILARDTYSVIAGEVHRRIALSDPGIDDYRNEILWYPHSPTIIRAELELRNKAGEVIDEVRSYTALRSIGVQGDRFCLNGRPYYMRLVLDQGYWQETGLTSPDDEALRRDVELIKQMGFNGARRHQKVSDPRYLYWADMLGLLVWEEMPSPYRFTRRGVRRLTREWSEVIERDISHPCIVAWVPFNESWGVPDLPDSPAQRHYVQALYHLTKSLDPSRPVVGNDGWESVATDIIGIHDYAADPEVLLRRYQHDESERLFKRERPGGRMLLIGQQHAEHPIVLSEFGGITYSRDTKGTWGYSRARTPADLKQRYTELLEAVRSLPMLAGFCYTQFADTYQEANGLLFVDRTPKFPLDQMALATGGTEAQKDIMAAEAVWRQRMMNIQMDQYMVPAEDHLVMTPR